MATCYKRINGLLNALSIDRLITHVRTPLFANGYALILSSVTTSGFGLLYWTVAAHLYNTTSVGLNSAAISAMMFLGSVAQFNLASVLTRFIPEAGRSIRKLVISAYIVSAVAALGFSLVFMAGIELFSPELDRFLDNSHLKLSFTAAVILWTMFVIQDGVLTGLRRAIWVPIENSGFAITKVILLVIFAISMPFDGVFASWTVAVAATIVPTNVYIFRRLLSKLTNTGQPSTVGPARIMRYIIGDFFGAMFWLGTTSLLPILVIRVAGAKATAYFYLCWTIAYALYLISPNMGSSMIVEAVHDRTKLTIYSRKVLLQTLRIVVPIAAIFMIGAPLILRIFGNDYAIQGSLLLQLLAFSAIPNVVNSLFISVARIQGRTLVVFVVLALLCGSVVGLSLVFLVSYGIAGVGLAWALSQSVCAVILLILVFRPLWRQPADGPEANLADHYSGSDSIPVTTAEKPMAEQWHNAARIIKLGSVGMRRLLDSPALPWSTKSANRQRRQAITLLRELVPPQTTPNHLSESETWTVSRVIGTISDTSVFLIGSSAEPFSAVLKLPHTSAAALGLEHNVAVLRTLQSDVRLARWHRVIPTPLGEGVIDGQHYVIEQAMPGRSARTLLNDPVVGLRIQLSAARSIRELHAATLSVIAVDHEVLQRWVEEPMQELRFWNSGLPSSQRYNGAINRLSEQFRQSLFGRVLAVSWIHGDFHCGNLLFLPDGDQLTGIVDWEVASADDLPQLDPVYLLLSTRSAVRHRQLGSIVVELLKGGYWLPHEQAILDAAQFPGDPVDIQTLLLLSWLRNIAANRKQCNRAVDNWLWEAKNIHPVLQNI